MSILLLALMLTYIALVLFEIFYVHKEIKSLKLDIPLLENEVGYYKKYVENLHSQLCRIEEALKRDHQKLDEIALFLNAKWVNYPNRQIDHFQLESKSPSLAQLLLERFNLELVKTEAKWELKIKE